MNLDDTFRQDQGPPMYFTHKNHILQLCNMVHKIFIYTRAGGPAYESRHPELRDQRTALLIQRRGALLPGRRMATCPPCPSTLRIANTFAAGNAIRFPSSWTESSLIFA